jgi:uncharacterized membrane protein
MSSTEHHHREIREFETRQLERLIFFSDAVFAIAITLLVLDLRLPENSGGALDLSSMGPKLFGFALSFAVIGAYWLYHHMLFGRLLKEDLLLRIVNLAFLASIVFLPFPTSVITNFPASKASVIFYALSVAAVGLLVTALSVVSRRRAIAGEVSAENSAAVWFARSIVTPLVFAISAFVSMRSRRR